MSIDPGASLPAVAVVGTGGTISFAGSPPLDLITYGSVGEARGIEEVVRTLPELEGVARIRPVEFCREDFKTYALGPDLWSELARRINALLGDDGEHGVVVTHGSVFLEETAYFLNLTVSSPRPVVVTCSQRPFSALSSDVGINLVDAVRVAASDASQGRGVLVVANSVILAAREARKRSPYRVDLFGPDDFSYLGYVDGDGTVRFYRDVVRCHTVASEFDVDSIQQLPTVSVIYVCSGDDGSLLRHVADRGDDGVVIIAPGSGAMPPDVRRAAEHCATSGVLTVIASRSESGRVVEHGAMVSSGFIGADTLTPAKARVLLMLALTKTHSVDAIRQMFARY